MLGSGMQYNWIEADFVLVHMEIHLLNDNRGVAEATIPRCAPPIGAAVLSRDFRDETTYA